MSSVVPPGGHVADLMCGTGAVSAALRRSGFRVTAVDVMTFAFHHARVALLLSEPPDFQGAAAFIQEHGRRGGQRLLPVSAYEGMLEALSNLPPERGYFWREFSPEGRPANGRRARNYFTAENACRIDAVRGAIRVLGEGGQITDLERSLLLHDLIMAANDVANIAGTYGHYLSKTVDRARLPLRLRPAVISRVGETSGHTVLRGYAEEVAASITCDLCYIDPPYMKRQYAANYHILETLAREDSPEAVGDSGLRPWRDQYSNFCTRTKIGGSFRTIVREMNCRRFLISYSEDGLLSIDELESILAPFGRTQVSAFKYKRFRSNASPLGTELAEYLIDLEVDR